MPKAVKASKVIHPRSRLAGQLSRKAHHEKKIERCHKKKGSKFEVLGEKLNWFQQNLDEEKKCYTKAEACALVDSYLERFNEELEQIGIVNSMKGRDGQQYASRLQAINNTIETETKLYNENGIEIPDVMNGKALKYFREWTGELRYLPNIKLRTLKAMNDDTADDEDNQDDENEMD